MKILSLNSSNFGSTGNIMIGIAEEARSCGHETAVACPASRSNSKKETQGQIFIGDRISRNLHLQLSRITGLNGCYQMWATRKFLKKVTKFAPDVIHLHNLHNCYINLPMLFSYIKKHSIPVVWTLHDCWAFTGHCPYFDMVSCDKWKNGCYACPQYKNYPESLIDNSKNMYRRKKKWFCGIKNMIVVTPSEWLSDLAKQSFLGEYHVKVINNGIDLSVFCPSDSDFREKYDLCGKKIVLGVAFGWEKRKGLDVFLKLYDRLSDEYKIVLVGTDEAVEQLLPDGIIAIRRTESREELAKIYSAADVFVNPTREDNFPTVNMEALACGTPAVTFKSGGSPEIADALSGISVEKDDIFALQNAIIEICTSEKYCAEACRKRAEAFDMKDKFKEYVDLYEELSDVTE